MPGWLTVLNSLAGLAAAGFGVAALVRPVDPFSSDPGPSRYFSAMYAARSIPLGIGVAAGVWLSPRLAWTVGLLLVAALAQLGDVIVGLSHRQPGMIIGAGLAAVIHLGGLVCAVV